MKITTLAEAQEAAQELHGFLNQLGTMFGGTTPTAAPAPMVMAPPMRVSQQVLGRAPVLAERRKPYSGTSEWTAVSRKQFILDALSNGRIWSATQIADKAVAEGKIPSGERDLWASRFGATMNDMTRFPPYGLQHTPRLGWSLKAGGPVTNHHPVATQVTSNGQWSLEDRRKFTDDCLCQGGHWTAKRIIDLAIASKVCNPRDRRTYATRIYSQLWIMWIAGTIKKDDRGFYLDPSAPASPTAADPAAALPATALAGSTATVEDTARTSESGKL